MKDWNGCTALITGASSGIGEEFAVQLAPVAKRLVLVARRHERLAALKSELLKERPDLEVIVCAADLSLSDERERLVASLDAMEIVPDLLVNNAGLGDFGEFSRSKWEKTDAMLQVNMVALTHLSRLLVWRMSEKKRGAVINVSSLASLIPIPDFAVYAATKGYVTQFSEGLRTEVREHGVSVTAVCPGPVGTEFGEVASREGETKAEAPGAGFFHVTPALVVGKALAGAARNKARVYPGGMVRVIAWSFGLLPPWARRLLTRRRPRKSTD